LGDPHDRLKVVCAFDSDLARARGTVLRPPSAVSSFGGFRTPAAEYAAPSLKRPASETLHKNGSRGLAAGCLLCPRERTSTNGYRTATITGLVVLAAAATLRGDSGVTRDALFRLAKGQNAPRAFPRAPESKSQRARRLFAPFALIGSGRSGRVRDGQHSLIGEGWLVILHFDEAKFNQCHQIVLADGR
jgi:hypothetical protein